MESSSESRNQVEEILSFAMENPDARRFADPSYAISIVKQGRLACQAPLALSVYQFCLNRQEAKALGEEPQPISRRFLQIGYRVGSSAPSSRWEQ